MKGHSVSGPTDAIRVKRLWIVTLALCAVAATFVSSAALAQDYPNRPIRLVAPYPAGGGTDVVARMVAAEMSKKLGQTVIVDNRPGAAGTLGAAIAAKAPPDGYTLMIGGVANLTLRPIMDPNLSYNVERDLAPISHLVNYDYVLLGRQGLDISSPQQFLDYVRANPGKLTYGSSGSGGPQHLAMELLKSMAKLDMLHVPYGGDSPVISDLIGGRIDFTITTATPGVVELVRSGRLRMIAAVNPIRSKIFPNSPTVSESALPGYEIQAYGGILAPAGTPPQIVNKLSQVIAGIMHDKEFSDRMAQSGMFTVGSTPEEFAKLLHNEREKWGPIIQFAGVKLD